MKDVNGTQSQHHEAKFFRSHYDFLGDVVRSMPPNARLLLYRPLAAKLKETQDNFKEHIFARRCGLGQNW